ncbi:hypothetical protein GJA_4516 [Janthinobacterium agaricidamnosum NBRC 102515 = DSM 9628]|uniref:Uncharacterized protein n=1 Tax=Janthinobacterium agaricidamnosum NBRC 102515 = DSM 9628 TaxID=1349767 RepID=W0VCM9_9BURK|nr:hypothetical protein GJA_4516 [Janthinobacterium agaricidamnosum NBRC 102515 = DSM 9628]
MTRNAGNGLIQHPLRTLFSRFVLKQAEPWIRVQTGFFLISFSFHLL